MPESKTEWQDHGLGPGFRWEKLAEPDKEDIKTYGEGVEVWELWDFQGGEGVIQTHFITEKDNDDARK